MNKKYLLLIDIGGTKLRAAIGLKNGRIIQKIEGFTKVTSGADGTLKDLFNLCDKAINQAKIDLNEIDKIGISFGGPVNFKAGKIIKSQHVKGWNNYPLCRFLTKKYGIPAVIDNDGNVTALGEYHFGAGKGTKSMVYLTVSTGIGGGIIIDGKLWRGHNNLAGEIGHIIVVQDGLKCECGKQGCVEAYSSGFSLGKNTQRHLQSHPEQKTLIRKLVHNDLQKITGMEIFMAADQGDTFAQKIIDEAIKYLGLAIGNVISILDIEKVVIGGGMTNSEQQFFQPLQKYVDRYAMFQDDYHVPIVRAKYKDEAGIIGSIALTQDFS